MDVLAVKGVRTCKLVGLEHGSSAHLCSISIGKERLYTSLCNYNKLAEACESVAVL